MNLPGKKDEHGNDEDEENLDCATGDPKVWADIADKAQEELDKDGLKTKN